MFKHPGRSRYKCLVPSSYRYDIHVLLYFNCVPRIDIRVLVILALCGDEQSALLRRQRRVTTFGHEGVRPLESFLTRWQERTFLPLPRICPPMAMFIPIYRSVPSNGATRSKLSFRVGKMEDSVVYRPVNMLFPLTAAYPCMYSNPQHDTWRH